MSDFSAQVPVESEKVDWLHDRSVRPVRVFAQPSTILMIIVAIFASMALIALAFQARASWDVARDWVVPATIPLFSIAVVSLVHLVTRRAFRELMPAVFFICLVLIFTVLNLVRAGFSEGPDVMRDSFSIITGISLGFTVVAALGAAVWIEFRRPTKVVSQ